MGVKLINIIKKLHNEVDKIYSKNYQDKKYDYINFEQWWNTIYSPSS